MTLPSMQEAMECIFNRLKMPVNEKVDLAIKYGSYEFSMKFIEVKINNNKNLESIIN